MCNVGIREDLHDAWEAFDDPWDRLRVIADAVVSKNTEATIYDLFNYIREDIFKGWKYDESSEFIKKIDLELAVELN